MIKLLSESTQAAELANESEWDITRRRTSIRLCAAPSVLLSKRKKQAQSGDDEKDGIKESNPNENAERNSEKATAGGEKRIAQTFEQPSGRLLTKNVEDKETEGHGRRLATTARPPKCNVSSPARQHQRSLPSAGRTGSRTKQP